MDSITVNEMIRATGGKLLSGSGEAAVSDVSIDSRKVGKDSLFIAIIGEVHDAHKFIPQVVESGCRTLMVSEPESAEALADCNVILVDDTVMAMQDLARYYLDRINVRRIAVTGSVGKTTTRDMVYYILSEKYVTGRPIANYNSNVGVPLTIFSFDDTMEVAVFELGLENIGDIHRYAEITEPEVGIITNVGISHMENLGSRENIRKAKMEIADFLGPDNMLVINESCDLLNKEDIHGDYKVVSIGYEDEDYVVSDVCDLGERGIEFTLKTGDVERRIALGVPGAHNAINAALAIAACTQFGISIDVACEGLKKLQLTGKRLSVREAHGIKVIDDSYNAAPDSMKSAINTLMNASGTRKVAILGGMNELGSDSRAYHEEIGRYAAEKGVSLFIGVADKARDMVAGAEEGGCRTLWFETKEELYPRLPELLQAGDVVLIKASNSLQMYKVADEIINR
jgi:UDP-N-acetylmuramoyl-tripeptide--D-alanyl-D-alanine ligase